ncbi:hypothetical protein GCM10028808_57060 [Spirosoma migulaei]
MRKLRTEITKQNWIEDKRLFDVPPRQVTWGRISLHLIFWSWDAWSAYIALDRVLRVDPAVHPDPALLRLMYTTHLGTTILLFYLYGYLVVPSLLKVLVYFRATNRLMWSKAVIVAVSSALVFLLFNAYDYYLFTYAAYYFKPVPAYVQRYSDLLLASGPIGIFNDYSVLTFLWAYNVSYVLLPLLLRIIREAISWGVESIDQKEQNQQLIQNQLQQLQYQINPHFLFNVFNNIYALIQRTNRDAADLLRKLSQLMHYTLYNTNANFVPLPGELQFLKNYVEIEQTRHFNPERIQFTQSGDSQRFLVPPLLLITFVENAFKHGLHNSYEEGWVRIELIINERNQTLQVNVSNSIATEAEPTERSGGVGLVNAQNRLNLLFNPKEYSLTVEETATNYRISLTIPLKSTPAYEYQS